MKDRRQPSVNQEIAALLGIPEQPVAAAARETITYPRPPRVPTTPEIIRLFSTFPSVISASIDETPNTPHKEYDTNNSFRHLLAFIDSKKIPTVTIALCDSHLGRKAYNQAVRRYLIRKYRSADVDVQKWRRSTRIILINTSKTPDEIEASFNGQLHDIQTFKERRKKGDIFSVYP